MRFTAAELARLSDSVTAGCQRLRELAWRLEDESIDEPELLAALTKAWGELAELHESIERRRGIVLADMV